MDTPNSAYLGIDASKGYADFILFNAQQEVLEPVFGLDDHPAGYEALAALLEDWQQKWHLDQIYCGLESTGGYENNWYTWLKNYGKCSDISLQVARLNARAVSGISLSSLCRSTSDRTSAQSIATYLIHYQKKIDFEESLPLDYSYLRQQYNFLRLLKKQCTQLSNQLEKLVYQYLPEIIPCCKDRMAAWLLKLLILAPSRAQMLALKDADWKKIPYCPSKKRKELVLALAQRPIDPLAEMMSDTIADLAQEVLHKQQLIKKKTKIIEQKAQSIPEVKLLTSMPGIGLYSALGLFIEINGIERFDSAKKLASYFGLHPAYKQSGDGKSKTRMSKQGRRLPREILYMVAKAALMHNPYLRQIYQKHKDNGKIPKAAMGILMHKILRIVFGILKHQKPYQERIDQQNQKKTSPPSAKEETKRTRFQKESLQAPVSKRNYKKRRAKTQPQNTERIKDEV